MRIWIDLDHAPHVPLFRPIIREMIRREHEVIVTARDYTQTLALCRYWNVPHEPIGCHGGKQKWRKILNLFHRASQLYGYVSGRRVDVAVSHGSRTQVLAAKWMRIPSILMFDYEYTEAHIFNRLARYLVCPAILSDERLAGAGFNLRKIRHYDGFKEQLYLNGFTPDPECRSELGIPRDRTLVVVRPSGMAVNYHDPLSEKLVIAILERVIRDERCYPLVVSRGREDRSLLESHFGSAIHFLEKAVDGLQIIWQSDVFISGGGTMNREAALLGVPAYSIFTGRRPYLDEHLAGMGKLTFIDSLDKADDIPFVKRDIPHTFVCGVPDITPDVCDLIEGLV